MPSGREKRRRAQKRRNKNRSASGREKNLEKMRSNYHAAKNGEKQLEGHAVAKDNKGADPGVAHDVLAHGSPPPQIEQQDCAMDDDGDDRSCSCQEGV